MALFRNMECRHVGSGKERSTLALEPEFWLAADKQAAAEGVSCREWVQAKLDRKPMGQGRASWLRVSLLKTALVDN